MSDSFPEIYEPLDEYWGPRCSAFDPTCPNCKAWAEFDRIAALEAERGATHREKWEKQRADAAEAKLAAVERLQAELAELRKDAERWKGYEELSHDPLPEGKTLMELFPILKRQAKEFAERTPQPVASVGICRESHALEVFLTNQHEYIGECIPGEGGDIALYRSRETGKVVGARLPLYAATFCFHPGGGLAAAKIDLRDATKEQANG